MQRWKVRILGALCGVAAAVAWSAAAGAATIGVDATHGIDADSILGSGGNFDDFRTTMTDAGHTIVLLSSFEAADLAPLDAVVLLTPYGAGGLVPPPAQSLYSTGQIAAIQAFATGSKFFVGDSSLWMDGDSGSDRPITFADNQLLLDNVIDFITGGGGLLVIGEGEGSADIDNLNEVVAPWGVSFGSVSSEGSGGHVISSFVAHPVLAGITEIGVDSQRRLTVTGPALDLTPGGGADDSLAVLTPEPGTAALLGWAMIALSLRRRRRGA